MHLTPADVAHACGVRGALRLVGRRHNNVGVSLRERRDTAQVMLGVSLQARWHATLVMLIIIIPMYRQRLVSIETFKCQVKK